MNRFILALAMAMPLGACATASFAPPSVNPQLRAAVGGPSGCSARVPAIAAEPITRDVEGALALTDNFILAYRCAERELADGRQAFQLPAFAAAAVGLVGPTLGLGHDGSLIAGTAAGVFNTGNSYYAPRAKAGIVSTATRALLCIKTEAVGITYYELVADEEDGAGTAQALDEAPGQLEPQLARLKTEERELQARRAADPSADQHLRDNWAQQRAVVAAMVKSSLVAVAAATDDSVFLPAETQYFEMVSGALFSVETILAERLRDAGSADTKGIFDQLTKLAEEHAAAKQKLKDAKPKPGTEGEAGEASFVSAEDEAHLIELENEVLRPRLQICVLQARA